MRKVNAGTLSKAVSLIPPTLTALGRGGRQFVVLKMGDKKLPVDSTHIRTFAASFSRKDAPVVLAPLEYDDEERRKEREESGLTDGVLLRWETGEMSLLGAHFPLLVEFDFDELCALAIGDGPTTPKVERLVKMLTPEGEEPPPVKAKRSLTEKLAKEEASLAKREADLIASIQAAASYASLDLSRLDRATALYSRRRRALSEIVRGMTLRAEFRGDFADMLKGFSPAFPERLVDEAETIMQIPHLHCAKRRVAAIGWFDKALGWLNRCTDPRAERLGQAWRYPRGRRYRGPAEGLSAGRQNEEYSYITWTSISDIAFTTEGWMTGMRAERIAKRALDSVTANKEALIEVQQALGLARLKLAYPKKARAKKLAPVLSADNTQPEIDTRKPFWEQLADALAMNQKEAIRV